MWTTLTTDKYHNMFGLEINHPPTGNSVVHDPYVLYKSDNFDIKHYTTLNSITMIENDPDKVKNILRALFPMREHKKSPDLLSLGPDDIENVISLYLGKKVIIQGIERAFDRIYEQPYHIFYYVETLEKVDTSKFW